MLNPPFSMAGQGLTLTSSLSTGTQSCMRHKIVYLGAKRGPSFKQFLN